MALLLKEVDFLSTVIEFLLESLDLGAEHGHLILQLHHLLQVLLQLLDIELQLSIEFTKVLRLIGLCPQLSRLLLQLLLQHVKVLQLTVQPLILHLLGIHFSYPLSQLIALFRYFLLQALHSSLLLGKLRLPLETLSLQLVVSLLPILVLFEQFGNLLL